LADEQPDIPARLRELTRQRAAAFRKELFPYIPYVLQSGLGLVAVGAILAASACYTKLLADPPSGWTLHVAAAAVLVLAAIRAPMRTYLLPADAVFLLPIEREALGAVVRPALRASQVRGAIRTLAAFALYAPLYIRSPATEAAAPAHPWPLLALLLAALGSWNGWAAWQEKRPPSAPWRFGLRCARWAATALSAAALLYRPLPLSAPLAAASLLAVSLAHRLPAKHRLPWERLAAEEAAARRRWYRAFSWFVDIPWQDTRPARRGWIAWTAERIPWRTGSSWTYLYAKTLLRGESFGAYWRWTAVIALLLLYARPASVDLALYLVGVWVGGLQLTELRRVRFPEYARVVPQNRERRRRARAAVVRAVGLAGTLLLWLAAALPAAGSGAGLSSAQANDAGLRLAALAVGALWSGWLVPRRTTRIGEDEADD